MKTKVNQMVVAVLFALFIISGNVDATEKEAIIVSGLENTIETKLELENWMFTDTYWVKAENVQEMEENLVIECWMTDEKNWRLAVNEYEVAEAEKQLELENWMTSNVFWN